MPAIERSTKPRTPYASFEFADASGVRTRVVLMDSCKDGEFVVRTFYEHVDRTDEGSGYYTEDFDTARDMLAQRIASKMPFVTWIRKELR